MIIETFKLVYDNEFIGLFNTQDINSVVMYHSFDYSSVKIVNYDAKKNKHFDFIIRKGNLYKFVDESKCELYINDELTALNFKDIADNYTNAIYCDRMLYIFGTSPSRRELDKHLRIRQVHNSSTKRSDIVKVNRLLNLEMHLTVRDMDKPYYDTISHKGNKVYVYTIVSVDGLCDYGVVFDSSYSECYSFFDFMLRYKRMMVFDSSTKSQYLITVDDNINISKLMFIAKGEV